MYCNIDVNRWKNTEAVSVSLQDIEVFFSIDIDIRQGISTTIFSLKIEEILWKKCRFIKIIMIQLWKSTDVRSNVMALKEMNHVY